MNKADINLKLEEFLSNPETKDIITDFRNLQSEYLKLLEVSKREQLEDFAQSGGNRKEFEYRRDDDDKKFEEIGARFKERKKKYDLQKAESEKENLLKKKEVITQIYALVNEEQIGKAINSLKELQEIWRNTGAVPQEKYKELQNEYSKSIEAFNYNLNIYKQLKDHDFKRNFDLKKEVIAKINALLQKENNREVEELLKVYRNEWEETGPVANEKWPELKDEFRKSMDGVYQKLNTYYEGLKSEKEENYKRKISLCEKLEVITRELPNTQKGWNNRTEEIIKLQEEWRKAGPVEKEKDQEVYKRFRSQCDAFFEKKKEFFNGLKDEQDKNKSLKEKLIDKAEALRESTDWKETGEQLIRMQKEWQKLGPAVQHIEQKLWHRFRTACNHFFEQRQKFVSEQDSKFLQNLTEKTELLNQLKAFTLSGDATADRTSLKDFAARWAVIGHVPSKDRKAVNDEFYRLLDENYDKMQLDQKERVMQKLQNKIDKFLTSDNAHELLRKESDFLRKKIEELNLSVLHYENNMGFIRNAEALRKEAEEKISVYRKQVEEFKDKLKVVSKAIKDLTSAPKAETPEQTKSE